MTLITGQQIRCTNSGDVDECFRGESTLVVPAKFLICRTARDTRKTTQLELCTNKLTFSLVCALFSLFSHNAVFPFAETQGQEKLV